MSEDKEFYLRFYVGHYGNFGHEFLEFEVMKDGRLRYGNNSNYKKDILIRKEAFVNPIVLRELEKVIQDSDIMQYSASNPDSPTRTGPPLTVSVDRSWISRSAIRNSL